MIRRLLAVLLVSFAAAGHGQTVPKVAAASDLKFALDEIVRDFERGTGSAVRVTYGSSGNFARQIEQGAPFDIFLSADEAYIEQLAGRGLTVDGGALYAIGRIVLFAPTGSPLKLDEQMADLRSALDDGRLRKFAIANPEHAPYGRAARQALQSAGLWPTIEKRLVLGENVSQAAQFAASGSAQGGIFALSLALSPNFAGRGSYIPLPETMHAPLRQRMVLLTRGAESARPFYEYLQRAEARAVLRRYGFMLPGQ